MEQHAATLRPWVGGRRSIAFKVPLTSGRIGRKVRLGVFSRGHEIASGRRPAYESWLVSECSKVEQTAKIEGSANGMFGESINDYCGPDKGRAGLFD